MLNSYEINDENFQIFSHLSFKEQIEINIPQKSRDMQVSVSRIVHSMLNMMKAKDLNEEESKVPKKPTKIYKRRTDRSNLQNSKKLISMKTAKVSSNDLKKQRQGKVMFLKHNSSLEKFDKTNLSFNQLNQISPHGQSLLRAPSFQKSIPKAKTMHVKSPSAYSRTTEEDKRRERVIKRLGCIDDRFVESLMMNTDKNFNVHKFLDVNMYQILRGKKREPHELKLHPLKELNLARIKENAVVEGEDTSDFSINQDIDYINSNYQKGCNKIKDLISYPPSKLNPLYLKESPPLNDAYPSGSKTERKEEELFNKKINKRNLTLNLDLPMINADKKFATSNDTHTPLINKFRKNSKSISKTNLPIKNQKLNVEKYNESNMRGEHTQNMVIPSSLTHKNSESQNFNFIKLNMGEPDSEPLPTKNSIFLKSPSEENTLLCSQYNSNLTERSKGILKKPSILKFSDLYKCKNSTNFATPANDNCTHNHRVTKSVVFKNK